MLYSCTIWRQWASKGYRHCQSATVQHTAISLYNLIETERCSMSVDEYRGRLSTCRSIIISVAGELKLSLCGSVGCVGSAIRYRYGWLKWASVSICNLIPMGATAGHCRYCVHNVYARKLHMAHGRRCIPIIPATAARGDTSTADAKLLQ